MTEIHADPWFRIGVENAAQIAPACRPHDLIDLCAGDSASQHGVGRDEKPSGLGTRTESSGITRPPRRLSILPSGIPSPHLQIKILISL